MTNQAEQASISCMLLLLRGLQIGSKVRILLIVHNVPSVFYKMILCEAPAQMSPQMEWNWTLGLLRHSVVLLHDRLNGFCRFLQVVVWHLQKMLAHSLITYCLCSCNFFVSCSLFVLVSLSPAVCLYRKQKVVSLPMMLSKKQCLMGKTATFRRLRPKPFRLKRSAQCCVALQQTSLTLELGCDSHP